MIIGHQHRFIFVKTRKTAGTSVELALSPFLEPGDLAMPLASEEEKLRRIKQGVRVGKRYGIGRSGRPCVLKTHSPLKCAYDLLGRKIYDYKVISLCRNPWDKAVSHFFWSMRETEVKSLNFPAQRAAFIAFTRQKGPRRWYDRLSGRMPPKALDGNYRLYLVNGAPRLDYVIRYEFLREDLAGLAAYLGPSGVPTLAGVSAKTGLRPGNSPRWTEYYDDETRRLVAEHSRAEIELFGYDFEGRNVPKGPLLTPTAANDRPEINFRTSLLGKKAG
jgi:hypothetical protein